MHYYVTSQNGHESWLTVNNVDYMYFHKEFIWTCEVVYTADVWRDPIEDEACPSWDELSQEDYLYAGREVRKGEGEGESVYTEFYFVIVYWNVQSTNAVESLQDSWGLYMLCISKHN